MDNTRKSLIKFLGYNHAYEVLLSIKARQEKDGEARFNDLMFDVKLNPGILNRMLVYGMELGLIAKTAKKRYALTEKGTRMLEHVKAIVDAGEDQAGEAKAEDLA